MDEPTLGLDPQTRNRIWEYIKLLNKEEGMPVFFTTQYMEEADKVAESVAIIDKGKILKIGKTDELKKLTDSSTLEDAFLKLTGYSIREESSSAIESLRKVRRMWRR